jgi:hypothetical protein
MNGSELYELLVNQRFSEIRCVVNDSLGCHWWNEAGCDLEQCRCQGEAKRQVSALIAEAAKHGWKLMPVEPTDEMVEGARMVTMHWHDIPGSQLTVNREKARRRYRAMAEKAEKVAKSA